MSTIGRQFDCIGFYMRLYRWWHRTMYDCQRLKRSVFWNIVRTNFFMKFYRWWHQKMRDYRRFKRFVLWNIVQPVIAGTVGSLFLTWLAFKELRQDQLFDIHLLYQAALHAAALAVLLLVFWSPFLLFAASFETSRSVFQKLKTFLQKQALYRTLETIFSKRFFGILSAPFRKGYQLLFHEKLLSILQGAIFGIRNLLITIIIILLFPYQLFHMLLKGFQPRTIIGVVAVLALIAFSLSVYYTTFFIIKASHGQTPASTRRLLKSKPQKLGHVSMYLIFVFIFLLVEGWFTAALIDKKQHPHEYVLEAPVFMYRYFKGDVEEDAFFQLLPPYRELFQGNLLDVEVYSSEGEDPLVRRNNWRFPDRDTERRMKLEANLLAWACITLVNTFIILVFGGFSSRILTAVLPVALQQSERIYIHIKEIILKTDVYTRNFRSYLANEYAFGVIGGFVGSIIYLGIPIVLHASEQYEVLAFSFNEDTAFFAAALMAAWLGPILVALYKIDDTFGKHFNAAIADHIMDIKDHVVYVGYGDIGKRIVDRNVRRAYVFGREENIKELVTPDLLVVRVFLAGIVLDTSDKDFIYAAENDLLGRYGVVAVESVGGMRLKRLNLIARAVNRICHWLQRPPLFTSKWQFSQEKRVLIPAIKGDIEEPFISARANLERARLLISTIPDHRDVNVVFNLVRNEKIKAILCVTRSDHMVYLTYRSSVRPVTLVYPVAIQGAVLGRQLWAAHLKMQRIRSLRSQGNAAKNHNDDAPRIYIIGTSKSNHYLLENFWMSCAGDSQKKADWIGKHIIHIRVERYDLAPRLLSETPPGPTQDKNDTPENNFPYIIKTHLPTRFGSRRSARQQPVLVARISRYILHADHIGVIAPLFKALPPDIILINPQDPEWALQVLMTIIRILERQHGFARKDAQRRFPLIMSMLLSHSDEEKETFGDTSLFYHNLLTLYGDHLAQDHTYPTLSRWDRQNERLLGETIIDAKQDVEENILGIERSLFQGDPSARGLFLKARTEYMELVTCTPNRPGMLARLTAFLAGFSVKASNTESPKLPSFQNMRVVATDPLGRASLATGFALLETPDKSTESDEPFFVRMYANDGRKYSGSLNDDQKHDLLRKIQTQSEPTVPGFFRHLIQRFPGHFPEQKDDAPTSYQISKKQFREILLDESDENRVRSCPGMNICPIATYQDYIVASNQIHFESESSDDDSSPIEDAPNYLCCNSFPKGLDGAIDTQERPAARIMVCFRSERDDPGKLAFALNSLLLRELDWNAGESTRGWDWIFNIQHLNDQPCTNRRFNLNRIFGFWEKRPPGPQMPPAIIQLVEILPIGSAKLAEEWYDYAQKLQDFLSRTTNQEYKLFCFDDQGKIWEAENLKSEISPAAIILAIRASVDTIRRQRPSRLGDYELCTICGMQGRAFSCEKWRPWPNEQEIQWRKRTKTKQSGETGSPPDASSRLS